MSRTGNKTKEGKSGFSQFFGEDVAAAGKATTFLPRGSAYSGPPPVERWDIRQPFYRHLVGVREEGRGRAKGGGRETGRGRRGISAIPQHLAGTE